MVKRLWACVKAERLHSQHLQLLILHIVLIEILFKIFNFSVRQHKLWIDAYLRLVLLWQSLHLVHCCKNNCLLTLRFN